MSDTNDRATNDPSANDRATNDPTTNDLTAIDPAPTSQDPTRAVDLGDERTEQLHRTETTQQLPVEPVASADEPVATPADRAPWTAPLPPRPSGPHAPAIILGLVCLAVAGLVMAQELGNLRIDWGNVGPLGFVAVGAVLVVLGAVGLVSSNRRNTRT